MERIRVLHVVTIMNRNGLENRIMDIYRNIDKEKIQFDFLTHRKIEGDFDNEIKELGGRVYYMEPLRIIHFFTYLINLNKFLKLHKNYGIIHSHINTFSTWVLLIAKRNNIPVRIAHSRTWGISKNWKAFFKYFSRIFVNIPTTHKFACSKQAGQWLFGKKGIQKPSYFKVIPNSIEINKFKFNLENRKRLRKELNLKDNQLAMINVGRLTDQKNQQFAIKVLYELKKLGIDVNLFIIGAGDLLEFLQKEVRKYKLEDKVVFLGTKSNVNDYLNAMDAFIFPSKYEGFGTVVIESQCNGLPTIASDSIPHETKISNYQEFMSLNEHPRKWAEKIISMVDKLEHKDCSALVKKAGYDIEDTYIELQNFYLEVNLRNK